MGHIHHVKLIVDVTLVSADQVSFVKYVIGPDAQSGWYLPNDLLLEEETPEEAARRLLKEQLSVTDVHLVLADIESFNGRDGTWHMAFHFRGVARPDTIVPIEAGGIAEHRRFPIDNMPAPAEAAHHGWYITVARKAIVGAD